ncbi:MAG: DNA methyltransferase [Sulfurimonas sp.]|jgi:DNA modification methylase|nr:DNA methyltransferase [Sulfurimonas sp.]
MDNIKVFNQVVTDEYAVYNGDSTEIIKGIKDNSIDYSLFSPPFASLFTYSNSNRDMGNSRTRSEFYKHFEFLAKELFRVIKNGRLLSFHCMNLPTSKQNDGYIGIHDFRGEMVRIFENAGFVFHSEVCIWKDPVVAQQRTKALGLLHKQIVKDSSMSRQGIPDYLVTMRKLGVNEDPISGGFEYYNGTDDFNEEFKPENGRLNRGSIMTWQRYASPIWMDINPSNTLQHRSCRSEKDERHICPLQLEVIERALQLWSNPGDTVLSPFGGIGSEGYQSLKMGRKTILCELKEEYFAQIAPNMEMAIKERINSAGLFDLEDE